MYITDIDLLQKYVDVTNDFRVTRLSGSEKISLKYLKSYFKEDLLMDIFSFSSDPDPDKVEMYETLMSAFCPLTLFYFTDQGEVSFSELGIIRTENDNTKTAYSGQIIRLKNTLNDMAMSSIDDLIGLLEETSDNSLKPKWEASPTFLNRKDLYIKKAVDFNVIEPIYRPQVTFIRLIPRMKEVQQVDFPTYFTPEILQEFADTSSSDQNVKDAFELAKKALVAKTLADAIQYNIITLTPDGLTAKSIRSNENSTEAFERAKLEDASSYYSRLIRSFNNYISLAKQKVTTNNESYIPKRFFA